jgi:hypothetical protein
MTDHSFTDRHCLTTLVGLITTVSAAVTCFLVDLAEIRLPSLESLSPFLGYINPNVFGALSTTATATHLHHWKSQIDDYNTHEDPHVDGPAVPGRTPDLRLRCYHSSRPCQRQRQVVSS